MSFNVYLCSVIFLSSSVFADAYQQIVLNPVQEEPFFVEPEVKRIEANGKDELLSKRVVMEKQAIVNPFVITPHKPNYFLPIHYQSDVESNDLLASDDALDNIEFTFQLSVKFPVASHVLGSDSRLWMAYTQKAFWQAYNSDISAPFRETNHEPEIFVTKNLKQGSMSLIPTYVAFGFNHNSNGQDGLESRSWNRVFAELFYETDNSVISIKPWYRIPEDSENDDNLNIEKYYGYGELNAIYLLDKYKMSLMLRNNLREDNKGAVELGFTFPLWGKSEGYIQYFSGYGHSLIEYNKYRQSFGIGIMVANWL